MLRVHRGRPGPPADPAGPPRPPRPHHDPLYRIRKLLLTAAEQLTSRGRARLPAGLTAGDPTGEVAAAWQGKELLRAVYAAADLAPAPRWTASTAGATAGSSSSWPGWPAPCAPGEAEILAWHRTAGCSNGPTEAINLLIKKVKRVSHGFHNFANYRLRLLLHCGITWQTHHTARLRSRSPRLVA